ncbi:adenylate cyclase [Jejuia pallidilutea]|uniref:Adenylate cyclase n=1 Tax=Jejuia pallidilutea TaxID=504487 RepID=A0A362X168_9FLAO|nr:adenylate/guanylate cyclase domain-containing protein [Jejuia pallidilutea]PQV49493.1 adenylate cyclase [Jejuia pallidilutea]
MKISPLVKRNALRILPFGCIWLLFACIFLWIEYAAIGDITNTPASAIKITPKILAFALTGITLIGLLVGSIEILFLNKIFEKKSLLTKIVSKFLIYLFIFFLIIFINYPIAVSLELNISVFHPTVWSRYVDFLFSITHLSTVIQLGVSLLFSLLYAEISENLGQNVLLNFFTGKYHKPVSETRIFMFVDMKSSTAIAEKLGHIKYFDFLKDYYFNLSNAIIKNQGEVYQYIGDEIVISWNFKAGIKQNNCINCFFDMKLDLEKKKDVYLKTYNIFPEFKAAIHYGQVTTGEIGALKKEIFFTGDVLNTTARIQGLCNIYNAELIISQNLIEHLNLTKDFTIRKLKEETLRGKKESIDLFEVEKIGEQQLL